ncbi:MAG: CDP-alcohol phosphatidyltransferase family protein [Bacteroidota bacterium]|nr:CDP-alcohol phosphatidyltransferase family protein [Bacteroidota bacterium]
MTAEVLRHQVWRPAEIEEPTNRWFIHPLSWRIVQWSAHWGVHPNVLSLAGLCCGLGAAVAYGFWEQRWTCVVGFALMVLWHVLDGADGQLARLTGTASEWGKVLDGLCDHGTFVAIYTSLAWSLLPQMGAESFFLAAVAGLSHFVQASSYERQRQLYEHWVFGKPTLVAAVERIPQTIRPFYRVYLAVQKYLSGEHRLRRVELLANTGSIAVLRQWYRYLFRPVVHGWSLLSSNYRTLVLFVTGALGSPAVFWWWECIGLNAALVVLQRWTYARQGRLWQVVQEQGFCERPLVSR